jgi:hypothetical protein
VVPVVVVLVSQATQLAVLEHLVRETLVALGTLQTFLEVLAVEVLGLLVERWVEMDFLLQLQVQLLHAEAVEEEEQTLEQEALQQEVLAVEETVAMVQPHLPQAQATRAAVEVVLVAQALVLVLLVRMVALVS